jgi:O-antigen/teichoic acid export membrane protein
MVRLAYDEPLKHDGVEVSIEYAGVVCDFLLLKPSDSFILSCASSHGKGIHLVNSPKDQSFWAIADQAAVSGGNFLTSLILARSLSRADYGTYSLLFLTLLSINTLHHAMVIYPLTIAIAGDPTRNFRQAVGRAISHALVLSVAWMVLLATMLLFLHRLDVFPAMALAMIAWHLQEVARQAFLANADIRNTILPDVLSYVGQAGILLLLRPTNLSLIFTCIAVTSAAALAWQLLLTRPQFSQPFRRDSVLRSWNLGKFTLVANLVGMAILQIPSWGLDIFRGRAAVGSYQALANLIGIANPIIFSMGAVLMPAVARAALISTERAKQTALKHGFRFGVLLLPCFLLLAFSPHRTMLMVYGQRSPYVALAPLLRIFAITFMLQFTGNTVGAYEAAMARPQAYMYSQFSCLATLGTVGLLLIRLYGISGAVYAGLIAAAARLLGFFPISARSSRAVELQQ